MTISTTTNRSPYYTTPGVGPFSFAFKVFAATDLRVIKANAAGVETVLTLNANYTVSLNADQNNNPGGSVTLTAGSALVSGEKLLILRVISARQETDIQNMGGFYPEVIEDALDRLTMLIQQQQEELNRSPKISPMSNIVVEDLLHALATRGDGFIWKGTWSPGTNYARNNLVYRGGSTYICVSTHTSAANFGADLSAGNWQLFAEKGLGDMLKSENLAGLTNIATARANIQAAKSGVNSDITRLDGITDYAGFLMGSVDAKTSTYTVVAADRGKLIDATSGSWTLNLTAAATLGNGFSFALRNSGAGTITVDPNGSELVDGATTVALEPGNSCLLVCDGVEWRTVGRRAPPAPTPASGRLLRITRYATPGSGTWTRPSDTVSVLIRAVGGGGGGSSGASISGASYVGGGGGAGGYTEIYINPAASSYAYTIGSGGAGGVNGANGASGGATTIAGMTAEGGSGGSGAGGGLGGNASGGHRNIIGGPGHNGSIHSSGNGGASYFAAGGRGIINNSATAGVSGSGGGGGFSNMAGGAGGAGYIEIWEFA